MMQDVDWDDPMIRFVGIVAEAAQARYAELVAKSSLKMSDEMADAFGNAVEGFLLILKDKESAKFFRKQYYDGKYLKWLREVSFRGVARKNNAELDTPPDIRRSQLTRLAFRLLRSGTTVRAFAAHMRRANSNYETPLPDEQLKGLMVWVARRWKAEQGNA